MTVINMTVRYFVIRLSTLKSIDQSEALTSLTNQRPREMFSSSNISTATLNLFNLFLGEGIIARVCSFEFGYFCVCVAIGIR